MWHGLAICVKIGKIAEFSDYGSTVSMVKFGRTGVVIGHAKNLTGAVFAILTHRSGLSARLRAINRPGRVERETGKVDGQE